MDLPETAHSVWLGSVPAPAFPALAGDKRVDVAIIGAGITGLTTALYLARAGKSVAILERGRVAGGVTGFTTAHLTEAVDTRYRTLVSDFGVEGAKRVLQSSREAIASIERISSEEGLACGFRRLPGYLYSESEGSEDIKEEAEALQRMGVRMEVTADVPLAFARVGLRFEQQAQFHPLEYLVPLSRKLQALGVVIFENTAVEEILEGEPHVLRTPTGDVQADHLVFAAHSPLSRILLQTKLARYQSYVLAFASRNKLPDALFWDTEDPYHYLRGLDLGSESLVIVGGEDHKTGQAEDTDARYRALVDYTRKRFDLEVVRFKWSSQVIEPVDGLPYIGPTSKGATTYHATGYSGNGMTFGTLAASILADAVLGRANPYADLYSPDRIKPLAAAKDFVVENVDVPVHLAARGLKLLSAPSADTVAPGGGDVVRHGGELLALYRDASGCAHALSPVCPHMGCLVTFNRSERTWDCPCHGSRFGTDGKVIAGPALKGLTPRDLEDDAPPGDEEMAVVT